MWFKKALTVALLCSFGHGTKKRSKSFDTISSFYVKMGQMLVHCSEVTFRLLHNIQFILMHHGKSAKQ